jgi:hypothetical protein
MTVNYENSAIIPISSLPMATNSEHHWSINICIPGLFCQVLQCGLSQKQFPKYCVCFAPLGNHELMPPPPPTSPSPTRPAATMTEKSRHFARSSSEVKCEMQQHLSTSKSPVVHDAAAAACCCCTSFLKRLYS